MLTIGSTMNSFGMYVLPRPRKDMGLSRANTNTGLILIKLGHGGVLADRRAHA